MKKSFIVILAVTFVFSACKKRLDSFLFNGDTSIEAYLLDDYKGPVSVELGPEYAISPDKIHKIQIPFTSEGKTLIQHAIYVGDIDRIAIDTVILYCHGNREHMDFYWPRQKMYANLGSKHRFGVLMFDYPGYGLSEGTPTESNMYESAEAAMKWLKEKGLTNERLIMFGFSLGTAPACELTANEGYSLKPSKIILEAPFASSEVMVQTSSVLNIPSSFFVNLKIDNAEEIKKINIPFLWIHGKNDSFLHIEKHGRVVFNNYGGSKKVAFEVEGGEHETNPTAMGLQTYQNTILNFITTN
jgi:pimeloyl-ACP methyl ester carboxylesterase